MSNSEQYGDSDNTKAAHWDFLKAVILWCKPGSHQHERSLALLQCPTLWILQCQVMGLAVHLGVSEALRRLEETVHIQARPAGRKRAAGAERERHMVPLPGLEAVLQLHLAAFGPHAPQNYFSTCVDSKHLH